ncbi:MAG: response regulator transcription factor [Sphingobacteriales bacterium]|nr:MAG: response regulator transcription factor [Sphingobacteriales bacterium]
MLIKVAITDDHPLAISGLKNMLSDVPHIEVANTYENGTLLLEGLRQSQPDVLLLDVQLPDIKGQELAEIISRDYPKVKILAITSLDAPIHVRSMMKHGCSGYVLKNIRVNALQHAIEQVYAGEQYIEPALKEQMMQNLLQVKKTSGGRTPALTQREKEILKLIVEENTNQEIAEKLFLSLRTIENHRFSLLQKLEVKNSIGLVKVAIQLGLVD